MATALLCSNKEGCSHGTVVDSLISHNSRLSRDFCDGIYMTHFYCSAGTFIVIDQEVNVSTCCRIGAGVFLL